MQHSPPPSRRRRAAFAAAVAVLLGAVGFAPAAHAADQGTGFGTWAPLSSTGWHGSMRVGDVHTYCIHPGLPVATGDTTDHGESSEVNGLSPQQLVSINHLVGTYGQTDDPVQAASVGWAVKAIVDRDTTLHSWGYTGDDLRGAIDHIMRRASPENNVSVQNLALTYLAEAEAMAVPRVGGTLTLTTQADDPTRGTVTADVDPTASGTLRLENAVFADTGAAERSGVVGGIVYPISAPVPAANDGRPYAVRATGTFTVETAAIRSYTTPDQQQSAGPARATTFELTAEDATTRPVRFAPHISTSAHLQDGQFVDEVAVESDEPWPRHEDGSFVVITATADVFATSSFPVESDEIPAGLDPVAHLELRTDPATGGGVYRVQSDPLPGPGVYTAVWRIDRGAQDAETMEHLSPGFVFVERFASPSQTTQWGDPPPVRVDPTPAASTPPPVTSSPPASTPAALAATGMSAAAIGGTGGIAAVVLAMGAAAYWIARRRGTPRT